MKFVEQIRAAAVGGALCIVVAACTGGAPQPASQQAADNSQGQANPPPQQYTLSVAKSGSGSGRITSSPAGINCGATCSARYAQDSAVELTAAVDQGSRFAGWSGACSGTAACAITMSADVAVTAKFDPIPPAAPTGQWLKGDLHVHDDHSADGSFLRQTVDQGAPGNNSVSDQIGQAERLGLNFLPLTDHRSYDQHYDPLWESSKLLLIPGEEANGGPHALVHGAADTIVQGANPPNAPDFVNLQQSIWDAHSQDASWSTAHPDNGEMNGDGSPNIKANAQGVDLVETWNRASTPDQEIDYAENRWNHGFRFGISGGSDDHFKELWPIASPGMPTTEVFAADSSERAVVDGLRSGHTSISGNAVAPFVTLEADLQRDGIFEAIGGDEVFAPVGTAGQMRIHVLNGTGTTVLLYKSPGRSAGAFKTFSPTLTDETYLVDTAVEAGPSWYRVEVRGPDLVSGIATNQLSDPNYVASYVVQPNQLRAICSPIFLSSGPVEATPEVQVPPDQGSDDGAELAAGSLGAFAGFPDIAVDGNIVHLVAEVHEPKATRVIYRRRDADGRWADVSIVSGASAFARFPRVAAQGRDVWVAWQDERAGQVPRRPAIYLRHSADGGQSWEAESLVRQIAGRAEHPALAITRDGLPLIAWQEISAGNAFDIYAQVIGKDSAPVNLSGAGKAVVAANPVDTRSARYPASVWPNVATAPSGELAVAWQDNRTDPNPLWTGGIVSGRGNDPNDWQIMVATQPVGAAWSSPVSLGSAAAADRHPSIAFDRKGSLVAVWDSKALSSSGVNLAILSSISSDGGHTFTLPAAVAPAPAAMGQFPRLGHERDGRVRVVWYDSRSADWRWRVMTAIAGSDGHWSDATLLVASRGNNTWPTTDGGLIAMASTRNAQRLQRDRTQQIFLTSVTAAASSNGPVITPTQLTVSPLNAVLASGEQYLYRALAMFSDGHSADVTDAVTWSSSAGNSATVSNAAGSAGTVVAGSVPGTVNIVAQLQALTASTPLSVIRPFAPPPPVAGAFPVKEADLVALMTQYYGNSPYRDAGSQVFTGVLRPYYLATDAATQADVLKRIAFTCAERTDDPTGSGRSLNFPFDLAIGQPGAALWHRYQCSFALHYTDASGQAVSYQSPDYFVNQIDVDYGRLDARPGVAFQDYNFGTTEAPRYPFLGRYVQPLDKMLRREDDSVPPNILAGVNGGYDYRVDAWSSSTSDNICPPRSSQTDRNHFYLHPAPAQCRMAGDAMPSCANGDTLPFSDDMGDSLVLLPGELRARSWRDSPFQSFNCGGVGEVFRRGAVVFYGDDVYTLRSSPNRGDLAELVHGGTQPAAALGSGPLLIQDGHFVYDQGESEEGMPIDNYELGGATGIGYEHGTGALRLHIVNVEGGDNVTGLHDWMLGLYFLSPYAHSEGALALGNGGDATLWVNPQGPAIKAVLRDPSQANHDLFQRYFQRNGNPGVVTNCNFSGDSVNCRARPVHDGLFVVVN